MADREIEPVRLHAADDVRLPKRVAAVLQARRAELGAQIVGGYAADWPDYKKRTGVIEGIDEALTICAKVDEELTGR